MGKAERNRQQNARQRIAMQQAAAKRAEARRKMFITGGSVLVVIVIVVALVVIKSLSSGSASAKHGSKTGAKAIPAVAAQVTSVPEAVLNQVGAGPTGSAAVAPLKTISDPALKLSGKPEVLYIGAEYCPYCAAERWALAQALSRFGTLSNLHFIHSESNDVYSNTSTLTFYKSAYTSKYISFHSVELYTVSGAKLQVPTKAEQTLLATHGDNFPFIDIAGKYDVVGSQYLPSALGTLQTKDPTHFGDTWQQIGADLANPNNPVAQEILGAANHITAAICKVTNDQPTSVCKSPSVTAVGGNI